MQIELYRRYKGTPLTNAFMKLDGTTTSGGSMIRPRVHADAR